MSDTEIEEITEWEGSKDSKAVRLEAAYQAWKDGNGAYNKSFIAKKFGVVYSTFWERCKGGKSKKEDAESRQKVLPVEEETLIGWVNELDRNGFPPRIERLRRMANDIIRARMPYFDEKKDGVGPNWHLRFLDRHPELKSRFVPPLDKERALAQDEKIFQAYFDLFWLTKHTYNIDWSDIYNMDEKGVMMGVIAKMKVIVSREKRFKGKPYVTQPGNRDWTSLIECVSMDGRLLKLWVIFKGKHHKREWFEALPPSGGNIAMSPNGWTDNELGLEWFERCFIPETEKTRKGKYRMLLFDGHASHISTPVIKLCIQHNIKLLGLPSHTTHLLQPLDVGLFAPLSIYYKNAIHAKSQFRYNESIDKVEFLEAYREARAKAFTKENILNAWRKTGHFPFNPKEVIQKIVPLPPALPIQTPLPKAIEVHTQPPSRPTTAGESAQIHIQAKTPVNVAEIEEIVNRQIQGKLNDIGEYILKLAKAGTKSMAEVVVTRATNKDLLDAVKKKKARQTRNGRKVGDGKARVYDETVIDERVKWSTTKWQEEVIKDFMKIPLTVFDFKPKKPRPKRPLRKTNTTILTIQPTIESPSKPLVKLRATKSTKAPKATTQLEAKEIDIKAKEREIIGTSRSGRTRFKAQVWGELY